MQFYSDEPTAESSWRLSVLMGVNTRTYKFALAKSLLAHARAGVTEVSLPELAAPYAMSLVTHLDQAPQASETLSLGEQDFLAVAQREAEASKQLGRPTEALIDAAVKSMPAMVMQKFHNLRGGVEVPRRFYELHGRGDHRLVVLTDTMRKIADSEQRDLLDDELAARWAIVETSFSTGVGRSLIDEGVAVDLDGLRLTDKRRRRVVTGVTDAVIGFQHGRCLICNERIAPSQLIAIDHVFPFSLMNRGGIGKWAGPDLDAVWNLAPAHASCNGAKSNRPPTKLEVARLAARNNAIMRSPYPLRTSLALTLRAAGYAGTDDRDWYSFLGRIVDEL